MAEDEKEVTGKPDTENHAPGCACCGGGEQTEEERKEDAAIIEADPASRSLSRALGTSFALLKLMMLITIGFFLLECVTYVDQGEVAVKRRFGAFVRDSEGKVKVYTAGLVFVLPEPIEKLETVSLQKRNLLLETQFAPGGAQKSLDPQMNAGKTMLDPATDGYNLTGDLNIVHSSWQIEYVVDEKVPHRYLLAVADHEIPNLQTPDKDDLRKPTPEDLLRVIAESVILRNVAGLNAMDALIEKNNELREFVERDIAAQLEDSEGRPLYGIRIARVNYAGPIVPPANVKRAFDSVTSALSERKTKIDKARGESVEIINQAKSEADMINQTAQVYAKRVETKAEADAARLKELLQQFPGDPEGLQVALEQYRLSLVREVLQGSGKIIMQPGRNSVVIFSPDPVVKEKEEK